jgi:hypothetical protein
MAMAPNFKTMLRKNMDDVKKPQPIPEGTYRARVASHSFDESAQKKTPFVRFQVVPTDAADGVDTDDLETSLQGQALTSKKLRCDFYLTDEALFRLKDLFVSCGIDSSGRTLEECIQEMDHKTVLIDVTKSPSQDGETFYNNIKTMRGESD